METGNLILTRKEGEHLTIEVPPGLPAGSRITVTAVDCVRGRVRLAIQADKRVIVLRGELVADCFQAGVGYTPRLEERTES